MEGRGSFRERVGGPKYQEKHIKVLASTQERQTKGKEKFVQDSERQADPANCMTARLVGVTRNFFFIMGVIRS